MAPRRKKTLQSTITGLQRHALDPAVPVSTLLRKARVVARELGLSEFRRWTELELNGYGKSDEIPRYRIVKGFLRCRNPYKGWVPFTFADPEKAEKLSRTYLIQPISEIEDAVTGSKKDDICCEDFSRDLELMLMEEMEARLQPLYFVSVSDLSRIPGTVRHIVLNWSLKLGKDRITGEDTPSSSKF